MLSNELWSPKNCDDCVISRGDPETERTGIPPCKRSDTCYTCPDIAEEGLSGNPWNRITAGNLYDSITIANDVMDMSSRDSQGLPTCDAFNFWTGCISVSEKLFWKVVARIAVARKSEAVENIKRSMRRFDG